jgi:hypothetical protein
VLSALVLTPSPAAPDPAHATSVTGYEPQRSGLLGDEHPAHFTIEAIHRIPSGSYRSLEPHKLAKRLACYHPCSTRAHLPLSAFVGSHQLLCACSDTVRPCDVLRTLLQVVSRPTLDVRSLPPIRLCPRRLRRPAPRRATPRAPRQRDPRAFQAAPQQATSPLQLPRRPAVRQRTGTAAESTAARHRLHRS